MPDPAADRAAIEARVHAFIADHFEWEDHWDKAGRVARASQPGLEGRLAALMAEVDRTDPRLEDSAADALRAISRRHCVNEDDLTKHGFGYGHPLKHHPDLETIQQTTLLGDKAEVRTQVLGEAGAVVPARYEYVLVRRADQWRIKRLREYFDSEDVYPEAAESLPETEFLEKLPFDEQCSIDLERAFQTQSINVNGERKPIRVESAGKIALRSGLILAHDVDYLAEAKPFALKAPPGEHEVIVSMTEDGLGFAKIVFRPDKAAVAFVPARRLGELDAAEESMVLALHGFMAVADAETLLAQNAFTLEKFGFGVAQEVLDSWPPLATFFASIEGKGATDFLVFCGEGGGLDGCPYWGLNPKGEPVSLVMDFQVYGQDRQMECVVPFSPSIFDQEIAHPALVKCGYRVHLSRSGGTVEIKESGRREYLETLLEDAAGEVINDTNRSGYNTAGRDGRSTFLKNVPETGDGWRLRFRWKVWEHAFAQG